jgi:hypothetical protein
LGPDNLAKIVSYPAGVNRQMMAQPTGGFNPLRLAGLGQVTAQTVSLRRSGA